MTNTKRRSKGDGSVNQLPSGRWRARVEIEPVDGKRQWLSAMADTKTEAIKRLKELQKDKDNNNILISSKKVTIKYQLDSYLNHLMALNRRGSVLRKNILYLNMLDKFVNGRAISKIDSNTMDSFINYKRSEGVQEVTIKGIVSILKGFFEWCVYSKLISHNPLFYFSKSQKSSKKTKIQIMTDEEHQLMKDYLQPLFDIFKDNKRYKHLAFKYRLFAYYCLAYETGIRIGELSALKWADIDFKADYVNIKTTEADDMYHKPVINATKTEAGIRRVYISESTCKLLQTIYDVQGHNYEWVCYYNGSQSHISRDGIRIAFNKAIKEAGIERRLTFHVLRHTNASKMIADGVPVPVICERLGHSDIGVTYRTYAHLIDKYKERYEPVVFA